MGPDPASAAARLADVCPPHVLAVIEQLHARGHAGYVVGGSVRDALLGRPPKDWDLATDARPERMLHLFPGAVYENAFGTVAVRRGGDVLEITTFRNEHEYADFRRPHRLEFGDDVRDDLARRDFTVNAIAWGVEAPVEGDAGAAAPIGEPAARSRRRDRRPVRRHRRPRARRSCARSATPARGSARMRSG